MRKTIHLALLALGTALVLAQPAAAAEELGSIRVTLQHGQLPAADGAVALYRAGTEVDGNYWLGEEFGGGMVLPADTLSPALAQWLEELAPEPEVVEPLDSQGSAEFSDLPSGLYLLVQTEASTGLLPMEPMTLTIPCQGQWNLQAFPKAQALTWAVPATGQSPLPFLGMVGMILSGGGLLLCLRHRRKKGSA